MPLIDTHAHLDDDHQSIDIVAVLARAEQVGVEKIVCVGTTAITSQKCVELAERFPMLLAAVGIQPNYCHEAAADDWSLIERLATHPRVAAIGETGLDRYWDNCPWEVQQDYFQRHWKLSQQLQLPVIIHMRECGTDIVEATKLAQQMGPTVGVMHSFTGDWNVCRDCLDLGLYISFAGMLTYKKSGDLREVAKQVPLDRLLVETDSPYLSPEPKRSQRPNEPALVRYTLECLAQVRGLSVQEMGEITTANAKRLFTKLA